MLDSKKPHQHVLLNLNDLRTLTAPLKNGLYTNVSTSEELTKKMDGSAYREPFDVIQARRLPELPDTPDMSGEFVGCFVDEAFCEKRLFEYRRVDLLLPLHLIPTFVGRCLAIYASN